jgi:hypothetical protein
MKTCLAVASLAAMLMTSVPAGADTEFDYSGNNFNYCFDVNTGSNSDCFSSRITGYFITTLSGAALDNLNNVFLQNTASMSDLVSFQFTDGLGLDLTQTNTDGQAIQISTDAAGNLTNWFIVMQQNFGFSPYQNDLEILSAPSAVVGADLSHHCISYGPLCSGDSENFESNPQGTWTSHAVNIPEPGNLPLFAGGLLALAGAAVRRGRYRRPTRRDSKCTPAPGR